MTDIRTYQQDIADEWLPLRIAGSLDSGATDTEYTPVHERIMAADTAAPTKLDMVALAETVLIAVDTDMDKERQRLSAIEERMSDFVQRLRNLEHALEDKRTMRLDWEARIYAEEDAKDAMLTTKDATE